MPNQNQPIMKPCVHYKAFGNRNTSHNKRRDVSYENSAGSDESVSVYPDQGSRTNVRLCFSNDQRANDR